MKNILIISTAPSISEAEKIAEILVNNKLAACCNIIPAIKSVYRWEGELKKEEEVMLHIKTIQQLEEEVISMIKQNHSYSVPEIIVLEIISGSEEYLNWLRSSLQN